MIFSLEDSPKKQNLGHDNNNHSFAKRSLEVQEILEVSSDENFTEHVNILEGKSQTTGPDFLFSENTLMETTLPNSENSQHPLHLYINNNNSNGTPQKQTSLLNSPRQNSNFALFLNTNSNQGMPSFFTANNSNSFLGSNMTLPLYENLLQVDDLSNDTKEKMLTFNLSSHSMHNNNENFSAWS